MKTQFTVAMAGMLVPAAILAAIDEIELKDWTLQDATVVEAQAKKSNRSIAQEALSWVLDQKGVTSVLVGASSVEQLANNIQTIL